MTNYDVIKKMIGEIRPVGESHIDDKRFDNLQETIKLVDELISDIVSVSEYSIRHESSMKKCGDTAKEFILELKETLKDYLEE